MEWLVAKARGASPQTYRQRRRPGAPVLNGARSPCCGAGPRSSTSTRTGGRVLGEGNGPGVRRILPAGDRLAPLRSRSGRAAPIWPRDHRRRNLAFLFIVASGIFLGGRVVDAGPRLRTVTLFKGDLRGKAAISTGTTRSASGRRFRSDHRGRGVVILTRGQATSSTVRRRCAASSWRRRRGARGRTGWARCPARVRGELVQARARGGRPKRQWRRACAVCAAAIRGCPARGDDCKAATQMPGWKSISVSLPAANAPRVVLTLDSGDGGQPQKRATLTLHCRSGETVRWEP